MGYGLDANWPVIAHWRKLYSALIGGQSGSNLRRKFGSHIGKGGHRSPNAKEGRCASANCRRSVGRPPWQQTTVLARQGWIGDNLLHLIFLLNPVGRSIGRRGLERASRRSRHGGQWCFPGSV